MSKLPKVTEDFKRALLIARTQRNQGVSYPQIAKRLNHEGFKTVRGLKWTDQTVQLHLEGKRRKSGMVRSAEKKTLDPLDLICDVAVTYLKDKDLAFKDKASLVIKILKAAI